jgi:hypothetical protein
MRAREADVRIALPVDQKRGGRVKQSEQANHRRRAGLGNTTARHRLWDNVYLAPIARTSFRLERPLSANRKSFTSEETLKNI